MNSLERLLPILATYGTGLFTALIAGSLLGVAVLGRGRPWSVPAGWTARLGSAALLLLALVGGACLWMVNGPLAPTLRQVRAIRAVVDRPVGEVEFRTVADDRPGRLTDLRGEVVVLNLWATWCGPCRRELPQIDRLQREYAERGVRVVTISSESRDLLLRFAARYPLGTTNVYASRLGWLDVPGRPISLVIDRSGVVRECVIGGRSHDEFEAMVKKYL